MILLPQILAGVFRSDKPRVTLSESGMVTVACRTSLKPKVATRWDGLVSVICSEEALLVALVSGGSPSTVATNIIIGGSPSTVYANGINGGTPAAFG